MPPLGSPDLSAIAPAAVSPQPDRAPDSLASGTPEALRSDLVALLGLDRVLARPIDLIRYATDASPYRLFPKVVVVAQDAEDVRKVLAFAGQRHESVTFRAAGTSLSGQAQGDGILVDVRRHWSGVKVEAGGRRLRARPGTILSRGNAALVPYGYRIGPDPASASACTIGGVIANNSSGMCCGTTQNSYKTLSSLTFMLPSGTTIDTSLPDAEQQFAAAEPALAAGLLEIKRTIESDPDLVARLRKKFSIKNTTGYHMEAFLDGATPCEIFRRLIVGSEGTLAFIVEAVFDTIPDDQFRLTSFMIFRRHVRGMCCREALRRQRRGRRGAARSRIAARRRRQARRARSMEGAARYRDRAAGRVPSSDRGRPDGSLAHRHRNTVRTAICWSRPRSRKTRRSRRSSGTYAADCCRRSAARVRRDRLSSSRTSASRRSGSPTARSTWLRCLPSTTTRASSSATLRRATCIS